MSLRRVVAGGLAAAIAGIVVSAAPQTAEKPDTKPGMTYESLQRLPDFSGWWLQEVATGGGAALARAPFRPEIAASLKNIMTKLAAGVDPVDLGTRSVYTYCAPTFAGRNGGVEDYVEFLFTPGRVTITNESGLVRRIPLRERPLPADVEESSSGTSVAHWEGQTLVVETGGLHNDAPFLPGPLGIKVGKQARIVERISLADADTLQIAMRMTAPELFTAPYETTTRYQRDRTHVFHETGRCGDPDRSIDPVTGRTRFDMTPPADLPPPPR